MLDFTIASIIATSRPIVHAKLDYCNTILFYGHCRNLDLRIRYDHHHLSLKLNYDYLEAFEFTKRLLETIIVTLIFVYKI